MKQHLTREMVNELRDVANAFHGTGQLRDRISHVVHKYLGADQFPDDPKIIGKEVVALTDADVAQLYSFGLAIESKLKEKNYGD